MIKSFFTRRFFSNDVIDYFHHGNISINYFVDSIVLILIYSSQIIIILLNVYHFPIQVWLKFFDENLEEIGDLDWLQSGSGLSRTISPVAFFHDGISTSEIDLRFNIIGSQRRAQAIATAPRRKRYDEEDDDNEEKKSKSIPIDLVDVFSDWWIGFLGYMKTPAVPIPTPSSMTQQTQSLPQRQSTINFRLDPPVRIDSDEFDYLFNQNRYSSTPFP